MKGEAYGYSKYRFLSNIYYLFSIPVHIQFCRKELGQGNR